MKPGVHFWTLGESQWDWDPDGEPDRYLTGYGHVFLELFARLRARGLDVTIGRWPPAGSRAVVASLEELTGWRREMLPEAAARLAAASFGCRRVVLIHGDLPLDIAIPRYVRTVVVPSTAAITDVTRQIVMPALPQRGLIPRDGDRGTRVECLALKCYRHNIPGFVLEPRFSERLAAIGVKLRIDTELDVPFRWHDFSGVDTVLCMRRLQPQFDDNDTYARKPPTKLINAWCARVIPIVAPEAAYIELARPGCDTVFASDEREILEVLDRLQSRPEEADRLFAASAARGVEFDSDVVLDKWENLLASDLPTSALVDAIASMLQHTARAAAKHIRQSGRDGCAG